MARELQPHQLVERSITKKYRKDIWNCFVEGVKRYSLISSGDKIGLTLEDTAESVLCAKLMGHLFRISDVPFEFFVKCTESAENVAKSLNIKCCDNLDMCNKIIETTCLTDAVESLLYSMFFEHSVKTVIPMERVGDVTVIRPMYCIERDSVYAFSRYNNLGYTKAVFDEEKRQFVNELLVDLKHKDSNIEMSIFNSLHAVCLDTLIAYSENGVRHTFLDNY